MPTPYEYALMSNAIYSDDLVTGAVVPTDATQQELHRRGWQLAAFITPRSDYRGGIWVHEASKSVVIAHRGSKNATSWVTDAESVVLHKPGAFVNDAIALLSHPMVIDYRGRGFRLSTTGHSLGGFLAQVCVYWSQRREFRSSYDPAMSGVVFDSPGVVDFLTVLQSNIPREQARIHLNHLNIHNFCLTPTFASTYGAQTGTMWHLPGAENVDDCSFFYGHSMQYILQGFDPSTGQPKQFRQVLDWPKADYSAYTRVSGVLSTVAGAPFNCLNNLYKKMKLMAGYGVSTTFYDQLSRREGQVQYFLRTTEEGGRSASLEELEQGLKLAMLGHYSLRTEQESKKCIDIHHFPVEVQAFLKQMPIAQRVIKDGSWQQALQEKYGETGLNVLQSFRIDEQAEKIELVLHDAYDGSIFDFQEKLHHLLGERRGCLSLLDFAATTLETLKADLRDAREGSNLAKKCQESITALERSIEDLNRQTEEASRRMAAPTQDIYGVLSAVATKRHTTAENVNEGITAADVTRVMQAAPAHQSPPPSGTVRVTSIAGAVATEEGSIARNRNVFYRPESSAAPKDDSTPTTSNSK